MIIIYIFDKSPKRKKNKIITTDDCELSGETLKFCKNLVIEKFRKELINKTDLEQEILFKLDRIIMGKIAANSILRQKLKEINELELKQLIYQILYEDYGMNI